jgi:sulfotransferase family protein
MSLAPYVNIAYVNREPETAAPLSGQGLPRTFRSRRGLVGKPMSAEMWLGADARIAPAITSAPEDRPATDRPIFLFSALPRSGSNYLAMLLGLHPDCRESQVPEDFFLANAATLVRFCRSVIESWEDESATRLGGAPQLMRQIGAGLLRFAEPNPEPDDAGRLLLRSPTCEGIEFAMSLFPDAQIILLVRDGPATVESGRRSFGWWYEEGMRAWRRSARRVLALGDGKHRHRCHLVRFEDLFADPAREIVKLAEFLDLDPDTYPFGRIDALAVLGSSTFGRKPGEPVHWRPVPRTADFNPLARARSWPRWRLKRFTWLAGAELARLGYPIPTLTPMDRALNIAADGWYATCRIVVRLALLRHSRPEIFADRQRRYLSWRHIRLIT